jgi:hypothetical protein
VGTSRPGNHAIAHNNVTVIEDVMVLSGSFDFTKVAQDRDAEKHSIPKDPALMPQDIENWGTHRAHSQP